MRRASILRLVSAALVAWATALPVRAQAPAADAFVGKPIGSIGVDVEGRPTTDPSIFDVLETKTGEPLSVADVRESITHLVTLARFEDVQVSASPMPDGRVALAYHLQPIHSVTKVEFRGDLGLSDGTLRNRMVDRFGPTPQAGRASDVAATLEQLYHERGYLEATVKPTRPVLQHNPDRATLFFDVNAGPRARIADATVLGKPLDPPPQVLSQLGIQKGDFYDPQDLRDRLDKYVTAIRHRGYFEAAVTEQPRVSADGATVDLRVEVNPGPIVNVKIEGDQLPKDKLAELVPIEREGSVDPDLIEDAANRIRDYLHQQGYWKADVRTERQETDDRLTIAFTVTKGTLYLVAPGGIEITGVHGLSVDELKPALSQLAAGDKFIAARLDAAANGIRGAYQRAGYAGVKVESAANQVGPGLVKPAIVVTEGPRTLVGNVTFEGNTHVPSAELLKLVQSRRGTPYYEPTIRADRESVLTAFLNRGYESAKVTEQTTSSADRTRADLHFTIVEGEQVIVDRILIVGNTKTDASLIRRELRLEPGKPLGLADLLESRRRLSALGLFRRVDITEAPHGFGPARDVIVTVQEATRTTLSYGGGAELDQRLRPTGPAGEAQLGYEVAPRGFFEVGRRNLGGRNRSVDFYTRFTLRPKDTQADPNTFSFSDYRIVGTYREPDAFSGYGELTGTAAIEQGVRSTFKFNRKGLNLELLHRVSSRIRTSYRYSFGTTRTFDVNLSPSEQFTLERVFSPVRLSTFSAAVARDTRDDVLEPQKGTLVTLDGTVDGRAMGSQVGFVKGVVEAFMYRGLGKPHLVFAGGARLGLATGFPADSRDLPASERFFAGGDTTIRGYAQDTVGAPDTISPDTGFPIGGNSLIILNGELRIPVYHDFGTAVFIDAGNVFARTGDFDVTALRGGAGFGLRYRSPIGPIRVDLGFKMDRRVIGGRLEPRMALHFSIGQAF